MPDQTLVQVIKPGHAYRLFNHESAESQEVHFIQKIASGVENEMTTVSEGTTNEAVLAMLIDRMEFLNEKMHSAYNDEAINHLKQALYALGKRTMERIERGVEGTHQA